MSAPVPTIPNVLKTGDPSIRIEAYIRCYRSFSIKIIAVESEKLSSTRKRLLKTFDHPSCKGALVVHSPKQLEHLMKMDLLKEQQTAKVQNKKPLVLLAPSQWPKFHDLMLDLIDFYAGPIFLIDNSCTAANWADQIISVKASGIVKVDCEAELRI